MKNNRVKAEKIFGGVSECKGMCTSGSECENTLECIEHYVPHYHDGEQVDPEAVIDVYEHVTEEEMSTHY